VGNYDIRLSTVVVVLVGLISLLSDWFLRFTVFGGGRRRSGDRGNGQLDVVFFAVGIALAVVSPIVAAVIQLAVSRRREYLADASGALLTRYPEGLASALEKISRHDLPLAEANKATAHLYFVNPLSLGDNRAAGVAASDRGGAGGWFTNLFNTHPPIQDRIKKLREMNLG
jgi:heat shock protein HtpX